MGGLYEVRLLHFSPRFGRKNVPCFTSHHVFVPWIVDFLLCTSFYRRRCVDDKSLHHVPLFSLFFSLYHYVISLPVPIQQGFTHQLAFFSPACLHRVPLPARLFNRGKEEVECFTTHEHIISYIETGWKGGTGTVTKYKNRF